jgi:hypothetical protein
MNILVYKWRCTSDRFVQMEMYIGLIGTEERNGTEGTVGRKSFKERHQGRKHTYRKT